MRLLIGLKSLRQWLPSSGGGSGPLAPIYDTRFGTDSASTIIANNGLFSFGLNTGNKQYFVNSKSGGPGSDSNNGLSYSTPKASFDAGIALLAAGSPGDQLLIAGGEGQTYTDNGLSNLNSMSGISSTYPTFVGCYDSTDPTNVSKYGKLFQGKRPKISFAGLPSIACTTTTGGHIAVQGLNLIGTDTAGGQQMIFQGQLDGLVFQNLILNGFQLTAQSTTTRSQTRNVSKCVFIAPWVASTAHIGGFFDAETEALWIQDCVYIHCGWKLGGSRDDPASLGGPTIFNHGQYMHAESNPNTMRVDRNVYINSSADGLGMRRSSTTTQCVTIDEPMVGAVSGWSANYSEEPGGATLTLDDILCVGGINLNSFLPRGQGPSSLNLSPSGNYINNLIAFDNSQYNVAGANDVLYSITNSDGNQQNQAITLSNIRCHNAYSRAQSMFWGTGATPPGTQSQVSVTWENCLIDSLAAYGSPGAPSSISGTGVRTWTSGDYPNPLTKSSFITAMGFSSLAGLVNAIAYTPEFPWAAAMFGVGATAFGAAPVYQTASVPNMTGITPDVVYKTTLGTLTISGTNFVRTAPSNVTFGNCSANFVLSSTDLPDSNTAGVTISSITASGTAVATVTTASPHGLSTGNTITVQGAVPASPFNTNNSGGPNPYPVKITVTSSTTFTYPIWTSYTGSATTVGTYTHVPWYIQGTTLFYDGSGTTAIGPTIHVTETNSDGIAVPTNTTPFVLSIANTPTLSGATVTGLAPTTETLNVTTNSPSGTWYWIVSTSATPPSVAQIQAGQDSTGATAVAHGSASAMGLALTATATGLSLSTNYYFYAQQTNSLSNNSAVVSSAVFQTKWTPAALTGLEAWVENDPSTVYADAGVTLATNGQTVQQLNDKSGHAYNFLQATSTKRPTWNNPGAGKPYFTGTGTQFFATAANINAVDASGQHVVAVAVRPSNFTAAMSAASVNGNNGSTSISKLGANITSGTEQCSSFGTTSFGNNGSALTAGAWQVLIMTVTTTQLQAYLNGVADTATAMTGTRNNSTANQSQAWFGANGGGAPWVGDMVGMVIVSGTLTGTDIANLNTYMAGLYT